MKRIPHTFTIVFSLIVLAAMLTWVVPAGEFLRHTVDGREVVLSDSFHFVDRAPQTWQVFSALFNGFVDKADIIIFILVVGGTFWIVNNSRAIDVGVMAFLRHVNRLSRYKIIGKLGVDNIIIAMVMLLFSLFGAIFGMSEETLAFVVVFVPLAITMGYDSIVGVCMCYVAAHVGFAGAMLNPFTIGIAQGIAGMPLGYIGVHAVMNRILIDNMTFTIIVKPVDYLLSLVITTVFAIMANIFMHRRIRNINMAESLKAVE